MRPHSHHLVHLYVVLQLHEGGQQVGGEAKQGDSLRLAAGEVGQGGHHLGQAHLLLHPVMDMDNLGRSDHQWKSRCHPGPGEHQVNYWSSQLKVLDLGEEGEETGLVEQTPEEAGHQVEEQPQQDEGGGVGDGRLLLVEQEEERGEEGEKEARLLVVED